MRPVRDPSLRWGEWLVVIVGSVALAGCASVAANENGAVPREAEATTATLASALLLTPEAPEWATPAPAVFRAHFETSAGNFVIEVTRVWAPLGADRFYNLVRLGFYDQVRFSRVVPDFIAQWGLNGDPGVIAAWKPSVIRDDPVHQSNTRGRIAYAMTGPDTRSTQVFISLVDLSRLDEEGFSPFGEVVRGMDVVDALYNGYGEESGGGMRAGNQGPVEAGGNDYLMARYPGLDFTIRATIVDSTPTS